MPGVKDLPRHQFETARAWADWLAAHHASSGPIALKLTRKGGAAGSLTHAQALEEALRHGWIDGQSASLGDEGWIIRFAPRGPKSLWSQVNRAKSEALIAEGRMTQAGLAEVERARADGRWDAAYSPTSKATVPPDLAKALKADPKAKAFFESLDSRNRYAVLHRLEIAKRPETRARRLGQFLEMLSEGRKLHP